VIALAGLGLVVVNALAESSWGTFTIVSTIPIAILMESGCSLSGKEKHRSYYCRCYPPFIGSNSWEGLFHPPQLRAGLLMTIKLYNSSRNLWIFCICTSCLAIIVPKGLSELNNEISRHRYVGIGILLCS